MIRTRQEIKQGNAATPNIQQINEATLAERWSREDLWADVAGEEIDDNAAFTLDGFDDLLADGDHYND